MFIAQPLRRLFPAAVVLAAICFGQPFGTWKLKAARSTFAGDIRPKSLTVRIEPRARGEVVTVYRTEINGQASSCSMVLYLDGVARGFRKTSAQGRSPHGGLTARPLKSCATVGLVFGPGSSGGRHQRTNSFWRFLNNVLTAAASAVG